MGQNERIVVPFDQGVVPCVASLEFLTFGHTDLLRIEIPGIIALGGTGHILGAIKNGALSRFYRDHFTAIRKTHIVDT